MIEKNDVEVADECPIDKPKFGIRYRYIVLAIILFMRVIFEW